MAVREYHTSELDEFVAACDRVGGISNPAARQLMASYALCYDTKPDQSLDPFSDEYFQQQAALYTELSGRPVDQEQGEMTPLNVDERAAGTNPYSSRDIRFIAKHARTIHTSLMLANLPAGAKVLDAGCGWGLSSESIAFSGASVTAVDINPLFVELVRRRAERLSLPITAVRSEFGAFDTNDRFDLLFFYECLHHSLKPWETLADLGRFVKPDGKIVIAGEPLNSVWWKDWGMRLDPLSVYCIRKFGWWESGWSPEFLARCFARVGFSLTYHPHLGLDNGQIGFACRQGREADVVPDLGMYGSIQHALSQVGQQLAERDGALAAERQQLAERDGALAAVRHQLAERDGALAAERQQLAERDGALAAVRHQVAERDAALAAGDAALAERQRELAERQQQLAERDVALVELRVQFAEREGRLAELRRHYADLAAAREAAWLQANQARHEAEQKDGRIATLQRAEAEARQALGDMLTSRSWRVTAPMRGVFRRLGLSLRR